MKTAIELLLGAAFIRSQRAPRTSLIKARHWSVAARGLAALVSVAVVLLLPAPAFATEFDITGEYEGYYQSVHGSKFDAVMKLIIEHVDPEKGTFYGTAAVGNDGSFLVEGKILGDPGWGPLRVQPVKITATSQVEPERVVHAVASVIVEAKLVSVDPDGAPKLVVSDVVIARLDENGKMTREDQGTAHLLGRRESRPSKVDITGEYDGMLTSNLSKEGVRVKAKVELDPDNGTGKAMITDEDGGSVNVSFLVFGNRVVGIGPGFASSGLREATQIGLEIIEFEPGLWELTGIIEGQLAEGAIVTPVMIAELMFLPAVQ